MNDDPELELNDIEPESDDAAYLAKRKRPGPRKSKVLPIVLGIVLAFVFGGGIFYFLSHQSAGGEANPLESKMAALEQRIAGLEKQLTDVQERISASGPDKILLQRVDTLALKMESLEKQKRPAAEPKENLSSPPKPTPSSEKQYHRVHKGETIQQISRKYRVSVEQLRRLNNLSAGQRLRSGQRLVVSVNR